MLQTTRAQPEKLRAGTRDVFWRWPHCIW
jgi:hypothetical protein